MNVLEEARIMPEYRHYADYIVKRAMSDLGSVDDFLRYVLFTDSFWQQKLIGVSKDIQGFEGPMQREDLNKAIKQNPGWRVPLS